MTDTEGGDFIRDIIRKDLEAGATHIVTRFPPEPNGYLHIGHAKSICLNFGVAEEFGGVCHLRFDDTNPAKEDVEYIESIQEDLRWLGFDWGDHLHFASDYFEQLYDWALHLIETGNAYVDDLSADEIREYRGTLTEPGRNSPHRDRSPSENTTLFEQMRNGDFPDGAKVLRAKMDMSSGNINLRDPVLYRIMRTMHPRTGNAWNIYPNYDFAHGQSDAIEAHHPLALHPGIRKPPPALQLVRRKLPRPVHPAPDRIRQTEPHLHDHEQAQASPARPRRPRFRLGRPSPPNHLRNPPPRLPAGSHPPFLQTNRHHQIQRHH